MKEIEKELENLLITKTDPELNKTVEAILEQELAHTKIAIGWIISETKDCFERAFIVELLKKHHKKLKEKI